MSLENHVPSLELCQKWKEIGGGQDTIFEWFHAGYGQYNLRFKCPPSAIQSTDNVEGIAAPLASELMKWEKEKGPSMDKVMFNTLFGWWVESKDKSLPNALMQMCIEMRGEK